MAKTSAQIIVDPMSGEAPVQTRSYSKFRKMRLHPTIALAREYSVAYVLSCSWSVEGDDPDEVAFIEQTVLPLREHYLRTALYGQADFGWKAYEKVFATRDVDLPSGTTRKLQVIDQLKPLKNDNTLARYKKEDGTFQGLSTTDLYSGEKILIDAPHSLFVNNDDEGLGNYAEGRMQRLEQTYDEWNTCNAGAREYDRKLAGLYLLVWYPVGSTLLDGVKTDNAIIAKQIVDAMRASSAVSIPLDLAEIMEQAAGKDGHAGWKIEFLDSQAKQASFVDRLKYLDALIARGFAIPERAILEGEFGTKAEAGIHASAALMNMDLEHIYLTNFFNWHAVNQLTLQNFDTENTVRLVPQPVNDDRRVLFGALLDKVLADPGRGAEVIDEIDVGQVFEVLGIPRDKAPGSEAEVAPDADDPNVQAPLAAPTTPPALVNGSPRRVTVSMM